MRTLHPVFDVFTLSHSTDTLGVLTGVAEQAKAPVLGLSLPTLSSEREMSRTRQPNRCSH